MANTYDVVDASAVPDWDDVADVLVIGMGIAAQAPAMPSPITSTSATSSQSGTADASTTS